MILKKKTKLHSSLLQRLSATLVCIMSINSHNMPLQNSKLNRIKKHSCNSYINVMSGKTHLLSRRSMWQDKFLCSHSYLSIFLIWLHTSFWKKNKICYRHSKYNEKKLIKIRLVHRPSFGKLCIISRSCWIQCALLWHLSSRDEIRGNKMFSTILPTCCTCCLTHSTENNTFSLQNPVMYPWTVAQSPWKWNLLQ
jgi:hypothetical protein